MRLAPYLCNSWPSVEMALSDGTTPMTASKEACLRVSVMSALQVSLTCTRAR